MSPEMDNSSDNIRSKAVNRKFADGTLSPADLGWHATENQLPIKVTLSATLSPPTLV